MNEFEVIAILVFAVFAFFVFMYCVFGIVDWLYRDK